MFSMENFRKKIRPTILDADRIISMREEWKQYTGGLRLQISITGTPAENSLAELWSASDIPDYKDI